MPHTNEEIARIHWNLIVADEVIFQGRKMTKDKFIHKTSSGAEEYAVSLVTFPAAPADRGNVRRSYNMKAQGVDYQWVRRDPSDISPKVSAIVFSSHHVLD